MGACVNFSVQLYSITCYKCGIEFAVPNHWDNKRRDDHQTFWCPNGHPQSYVGKTQTERDLEAARQEVDYLRRDAAFKAEQIKTLERKQKRQTRRIHAGVCPHCSRTFRQLAAHMKTKHAEQLGK
jgi:hypothetical protein